LNWMTRPTVIEEGDSTIVVVRKRDPARAECRGILVGTVIKARALAESRGLTCVEVDLEVLRGEREPDLTLFV
jgi:RecB family endonuclease NucS